MCTVSIIALCVTPGAYRLVTNRDEQRSRVRGEAPSWRTIGGVRAVGPRDPAGGGTWVATSERGLTLALLNGNLEPQPAEPASPRTRGEIIGRFLGLGTIDAIIAASRSTDFGSYPPFRMVCVEPGADGPRVADLFWNGKRIAWTAEHRVPCCFVSSGLGDSRVAPRVPLFEQTVGRSPGPEAQDSFHDHQWPERPEISVRMAREDARTVSITSVTVVPSVTGGADISVEHTPVPEVRPASLASAARVG